MEGDKVIISILRNVGKILIGDDVEWNFVLVEVLVYGGIKMKMLL